MSSLATTDACSAALQTLISMLPGPPLVIAGTTAIAAVKSGQAGRAVGLVYEMVVPDIEAILQALEALFDEIAKKINHAISALVAIVDDTSPCATEQRKRYCEVTLRIDDPYKLQKVYNKSLGILWKHKDQWRQVKSEYTVQRVGKTRTLAKKLKVLREQGVELDLKATSSSSRLLTEDPAGEPSSDAPPVTHTLVHAAPGDGVTRIAVECKPNGEPVIWV